MRRTGSVLFIERPNTGWFRRALALRRPSKILRQFRAKLLRWALTDDNEINPHVMWRTSEKWSEALLSIHLSKQEVLSGQRTWKWHGNARFLQYYIWNIVRKDRCPSILVSTTDLSNASVLLIPNCPSKICMRALFGHLKGSPGGQVNLIAWIHLRQQLLANGQRPEEKPECKFKWTENCAPKGISHTNQRELYPPKCCRGFSCLPFLFTCLS